MADASDVGRYGTIRLMKMTDPDAVVASYPIDDEVVTFGREPTCSVRLYYQWVSALHCKIIFEERKAFLQVMGANGVVVDGCQVMPTRSGINSDPTTIPLINGSNITIHKKRFVFSYPPKELRPQLFTPAAKRRGSLRLSMITSAQVFSPRPSMNPRENLRILQSPLRPFAGTGTDDEEVVKLVDGNHPRVVEEEQDLIIIEKVEAFSLIKATPPPQPQVTPRRKPMSSLHRAVLIRSAQRAQQKLSHRHTLQDVEEAIDPGLDNTEEEDEVEEVVGTDVAQLDESEEELGSGDVMSEDHSSEQVEESEEALFGDDTGENAENYEEDDLNEETPTSRSRTVIENMRPMPPLFSRSGNERTPRKSGPLRPPPGARFSMSAGLEDENLDGILDATKEKEIKAEEEGFIRPIVTAEERQAIIERRKSALKEASVEFIPGSRRTSALPPPQHSPFKKIGKGIDDGEETKSVLARMQETLQEMREKRITAAQNSPGIGRGQGILSSPTKPAFSLLARGASPRARSPAVTPSVPKTLEFRNEDWVDVNETSDQNAITKRGENTTKDDPRTPNLDGVRELFRIPAEPKTPSFQGIRELFGKSDKAPQQMHTPRLDGVKKMFAEPKVVESPHYDGLAEMMTIPEEGSEEEAMLEDDHTTHSVDSVSSDDKLPGAGVSRKTSKIPGRSRTGGSVTDTSAMADDEASLLEELPNEPKKQPKGTLMQRTVRLRQGKVQVSGDESGQAIGLRAKARGKLRGTEDDTSANQGKTTAGAVPSAEESKPRRRVVPAPAASSLTDQSVPKTRRRVANKTTTEGDSSSSSAIPAPIGGRRTRSRTASVERSDENPSDNMKQESSSERPKPRRVTRAKLSKDVDIDEPILETDEQGPAQPPIRKALGRTRRVKEEPSDDSEVVPKKKTGGGRRKLADDDAEVVQGKENTPDRVSTSPTDPVAGAKEVKKAVEKPTKTSKVKVEEKTTTTTTRTTRARSRK